MKEEVLKKQIELEAKEKALDKKVIDEIINKTAEIIDAKVKNLAEDLKRKIDESAKKPEEKLGTDPPTNSTDVPDVVVVDNGANITVTDAAQESHA